MDVALVIAGTSFVGRHLCRQLAGRGIAFKATSRTPQADFLVCDLTRPRAVEALLQSVRPRWIFNCARATPQGTSDEMHAVHVAATEALLGAAARHVPEAVTILFGSAAEYGPVRAELLPIREDVPALPQSSYGRSKLAQLQVAERVARAHGSRIHVVRPFNLVGPGLGKGLVAAALCDRLLRAKLEGRSGPIEVTNGHATRDWVDVRDAVDAVVRLALHAAPDPGSVGLYNIATGVETSVLELAEHLCRFAGGFHAVDASSAESSSGIDRSCGDATRLRSKTGWQPRVPWERSLEELWHSVRVA